ncbi:LysR family transcriptional regulator [Actinomadura welshii]|uniref:LysR family transcriptional regulator n=1 Tax=Actinomadura welshii TaxID=3103817 RepID=UPI0003F6763C|nr:LysR family transcriptional regulator [Actinomadura madurae]
MGRQVQRLEREMGVRLLERATHHVTLTPAGAAFLVELFNGRLDVGIGRAALAPSGVASHLFRLDCPEFCLYEDTVDSVHAAG